MNEAGCVYVHAVLKNEKVILESALGVWHGTLPDRSEPLGREAGHTFGHHGIFGASCWPESRGETGGYVFPSRMGLRRVGGGQCGL